MNSSTNVSSSVCKKAAPHVVHVSSVGYLPKYFLVEHFRLLLQDGFRVTLVCCDDDAANYCVAKTGVEFSPITIKQNTAPFSGILNLFRLKCLFKKLKPDIVDSHGSKAGFMGSIAGWMAKVPHRIYHNHGMALLSSSGIKAMVFRAIEYIACKCATEVIYVAPSNMEDAIKEKVCPREKAVVLGPGTICGVDTEKYNRQKHYSLGVKLRKKEGIPDDSFVVGFVGRIVAHKGVETILEAWRLLPDDLRKISYLCMFGGLGQPKMYSMVEQAVSEPGLNVKYLGFNDDMPAWYSVMSLLVQPSWHEGWGYNVLEAACYGVAAVGTRISATVDAIQDGKTGILVPVKDAQAMAEAIARLLKDEQLRNRLGQAAKKRTVEFFSQDKICPLLSREYRRILSESVTCKTTSKNP